MIDIPPVWLAVFAFVTYWQGQLIPTNWVPFGDVLGALLVLLGLCLMGLAFVEFAKHKTTVIPHQNPSALIRTGIFAKTRNPIYLGDAFVLAGLCLRWDAALSLVLVPIFGMLINQRFILAEENRLRDRFGAEFDDYRRVAGRWVPLNQR